MSTISEWLDETRARADDPILTTEGLAHTLNDLPRAVDALQAARNLPWKDISQAQDAYSEAWRSGYNQALIEVTRAIADALGVQP